MEPSVHILLVDDQPRNLDALEAILESPDYKLVRAQSAQEALLALLHREYAAIVLDIKMPGVSGLELAQLIKGRKRTQHVPILFLTAHLLEERDVLRGYGAGAVDYLSKPLNPEILRSKVSVFVDLYRKTRALAFANKSLVAEIAERQRVQEALRVANDALEGRVRERTTDLMLANSALRASEQRVRLLLEAVGEGICGFDAHGRATFVNPAAASLLGYEPSELIGIPIEHLMASVDEAGDAEAFVAPELETASSDEESAMAPRLRSLGRNLLRRKDGSNIPVEYLRTPIGTGANSFHGEVVVFRDLTGTLLAQRRLAAEHAVARILASATGMEAAAPQVLARLCETMDAPAGELWVTDECGSMLRRALAHADQGRDPESAALDQFLRAGETMSFASGAGLPGRIWERVQPVVVADVATDSDFPRARQASEAGIRGAWGFPIVDGGRFEGAVCLYSREETRPDEMLLAMANSIGREMGAFARRTRAEAELRGHHERLEELVRNRTRALERSHERLRQAERLATIGTLAAGLGHDMSNLLLPIRVRLRSLQEAQLSSEAAGDVLAVREAAGYLQRLASGLRLLAMDPERINERTPQTNLAAWWSEVEGVFRATLPRGVRLVGGIPEGLPPAAITPSRLTQAVFNLVQNAGEALASTGASRQGGDKGTIAIEAIADESGDLEGAGAANERFIVLSVSDDGPGMPQEVAERCFEPYFSTKVRAVSTGMGLPMVRAWIDGAGGRIDLDTKLGEGTRFVLRLPVSATNPAEPGEVARPSVSLVAMTVEDRRIAGFVMSMVNATSANAAVWCGDGVPEAKLWIVEGAAATQERVAAYLAQGAAHHAMVLADEHGREDAGAPYDSSRSGGPAPLRPTESRVRFLGRRPSTADLRRALVQALTDIKRRGGHEVDSGVDRRLDQAEA